jgi:hypothetical protein
MWKDYADFSGWSLTTQDFCQIVPQPHILLDSFFERTQGSDGRQACEAVFFKLKREIASKRILTPYDPTLLVILNVTPALWELQVSYRTSSIGKNDQLRSHPDH